MRKTILTLVLLPFVVAAPLATAQNTLNGQDMSKIMEQAQKAQACMQSIDQSKLEEIKKGSEQMETDIRALCDSDKRDEAQEKAIDYSRKMMKSEAMVKMRECTELMRGMLPEMPFDDFEEKMASSNVCDELK